MKLYRKIETGARTYNYFCPVFVGDRLIYFVLNNDSAFIRCEDVVEGDVVWEYFVNDAFTSRCVQQLYGGIVWQNRIIFATERMILSLDLETGTEQSEMKVLTDKPDLSVVGNNLFVTSGNEIIKIDLVKGKIIKRKKYRVKWLVGPVLEDDGKLYVATSNSKILRISNDDLTETLNCKYPGTWSVGVPAGIVGDRIVGSSYSQYVICFDKNTGEPLWQKKKKAGSEPSQVIDADKGIIYSCENINNKHITALRISDGKKLWDKETEIWEITDIDSKSMAGFLKSDNGDYEFVQIDKMTGELIAAQDIPKMHKSLEEPFRSYSMPMEIVHSDRFVAFVCGTGDIYQIQW